MLSIMRRRPIYFAAFAISVAITGAAWVTTGQPIHWSKGVVVAGSCTGVDAARVCQVELVPDGARVRAQSDAALTGGDWVELRVWRNLITGTENYTVVR
jgi:hypothetical protein